MLLSDCFALCLTFVLQILMNVLPMPADLMLSALTQLAHTPVPARLAMSCLLARTSRLMGAQVRSRPNRAQFIK
jgi:hypothetical protein